MASLRSKGKKVPKPCHYIAVGGLNAYNQLIIKKYMEILSPLKEATSLVKGRGKASKHSAIQKVICYRRFKCNITTTWRRVGGSQLVNTGTVQDGSSGTI